MLSISKHLLISFREWLHSYIRIIYHQRCGYWVSSHLFQRVASFLHLSCSWFWITRAKRFSSLSESGFIPTSFLNLKPATLTSDVLISFREWLHSYVLDLLQGTFERLGRVLISFREWLHSYSFLLKLLLVLNNQSSHLFQRVASFLPAVKRQKPAKK